VHRNSSTYAVRLVIRDFQARAPRHEPIRVLFNEPTRTIKRTRVTTRVAATEARLTIVLMSLTRWTSNRCARMSVSILAQRLYRRSQSPFIPYARTPYAPEHPRVQSPSFPRKIPRDTRAFKTPLNAPDGRRSTRKSSFIGARERGANSPANPRLSPPLLVL